MSSAGSGSARRRALVAEDDLAARLALEGLLEEEGFEVMAVADGLDAWERCERFRPDLLLSDVQMPRLDGFELARRLLERWPGTVIILMTGLEQEARATSPGVVVVEKPVDIDGLLELIEHRFQESAR